MVIRSGGTYSTHTRTYGSAPEDPLQASLTSSWHSLRAQRVLPPPDEHFLLSGMDWFAVESLCCNHCELSPGEFSGFWSLHTHTHAQHRTGRLLEDLLSTFFWKSVHMPSLLPCGCLFSCCSKGLPLPLPPTAKLSTRCLCILVKLQASSSTAVSGDSLSAMAAGV